jgi:hypothetical protein
VTKTEIDLARQKEGVESFGVSRIAGAIVSLWLQLFRFYKNILPKKTRKWIKKRHNIHVYLKDSENDTDKRSFDLLRAAVNLTVASALISVGTILKLPLSTTYVTFMVAMGSALADGAWGKESAVYRINGVLTVIGGWIFTAIIAFIFAAVLAVFIYFIKLPMVILLIISAVFFVYRTHILFRKKQN